MNVAPVASGALVITAGADGYALDASLARGLMPAAVTPARRFGFWAYGASAAPLAAGGAPAVPAAAVAVSDREIGSLPSSVAAVGVQFRCATRAQEPVPAGLR